MKNILYMLLLLPFCVLGQTTSQNYVKMVTYKQGSTTAIATPTAVQAKVDVTYIDGLGRPVQQVAHRQSGTGKDIVTPITYDAYGRQAIDYLPFPSQSTTMGFVANATIIGSQQSYYGTAYGTEGGNAYSEKRFEASPLNRVLEQGAPGTTWVIDPSSDSDHTIKFDYLTNTETIARLKATATTPSAGNYSISIANVGSYQAGQLYKTVTKSENWQASNGVNGTVVEFKDQQGKVVLKRTYSANVNYDTYYVYDQYGNLAYVLPPEAGPTTTGTVLDELCYQYKYDYRNRLVEKKLPGKQWEFIVYDKLDRVVATGPANAPFADLNAQGKKGWLVTKYDVLGRVVLTGWKESSVTSATRKLLQDLHNSKTVLSEGRGPEITVAGVPLMYTNVCEPVASYHLLTINYYDDYDFTASTSWVPAALETSTLGQPVYYNRTVKPKGLATGNWVRVLENSNQYKSDRSYVLYDVKDRPIYTFKRNYLGGFDVKQTLYDFEGKVLQLRNSHRRLSGSASLITTDYFTYTDQGRLLQHKQKVGSLAEELISRNEYDDLGQLKNKRVGGPAATPTGLQKVDYTYNIRGWLKGINDIGNLNLGGGDPNDLFAFRLGYDEGVKPLYNGNISQTLWKASSDNTVRKYDYRYDPLNRLLSASYSKPDDPQAFGAYNEAVLYDRNGNIQSLTRYGYLDADNGSNYMIDYLGYTYGSSSNKLLTVEDYSGSIDGFRDGQNPDPGKPDYEYDADGNMTADWNKGIKSIRYNHLNLPVKIEFQMSQGQKYIDYLYNALGVKLSKVAVNESPDGPQGTSVVEYLEGFHYDGQAKLLFFPTAEGYVSVTNDTDYKYVYNYTDHLGNIRLGYTQDGGMLKITEENHYYPFGMKHNYNASIKEWSGSAVTGDLQAVLKPVDRSKYQYKYNGKEYQDELNLNWYDYGARNYDPAIGRWMNIDPLAEISRRWSPYTYAYNNPIYFIDLDGMQAVGGPYPSSSETLKNVKGYNSKNKTFYSEKIVASSTSKYEPMSNVTAFSNLFGFTDVPNLNDISDKVTVTTTSTGGIYKNEKGETVSSANEATTFIEGKSVTTQTADISNDALPKTIDVTQTNSSTTYKVSMNKDGKPVLTDGKTVKTTSTETASINKASSQLLNTAVEKIKTNVEVKKENFDKANDAIKGAIDSINK